MRVVKDFLDVLEELPRLPPGKQNEFGIVTPQIRDVTGQRKTYTYASEALTY